MKRSQVVIEGSATKSNKPLKIRVKLFYLPCHSALYYLSQHFPMGHGFMPLKCKQFLFQTDRQ